MSYASVNFHDVTSIVLKEKASLSAHRWITLELRDSKGQTLELTIYSDDTASLIASIAHQAQDIDRRNAVPQVSEAA